MGGRSSDLRRAANSRRSAIDHTERLRDHDVAVLGDHRRGERRAPGLAAAASGGQSVTASDSLLMNVDGSSQRFDRTGGAD
jgi:hypothetical protein